MLSIRSLGQVLLASLLVASVVALRAAPAVHAGIRGPVTHNRQVTLQSAFHKAAREFGVPESVLLSVSYNVSRWDDHGATPSTSGGYGPMHLTHADGPDGADARGDGHVRRSPSSRDDATFHSLDVASRLLGVRPGVLERDPVQNIRGGAALLARYARETTGERPASIAEWYGAVAKYSGSPATAIALDFADAVYHTIRNGVTRATANGQLVRLPAHSVQPDAATVRPLHLHPEQQTAAECPRKLLCQFVPAAYRVNNPSNPEDYGNYDVANRDKDGLAIRYIVIHDTEGPYAGAVNSFRNSARYASANYVLRAADGQVTQMVDNEDVAWHAGNYYVNMHAIGIEHEGMAIDGATWYSEQLYQTSAQLVRYLAHRYHVPLDRAHILGHDEVPGVTPATQTSQHWDPGPYWDWQHYMELLQAPLEATSDDTDSKIVTINPTFALNQPPVTYCRGAGDCRSLPAQPSNFVYLYTAPSLDAPLLSDTALHASSGVGTTRAPDWGDKAVTGQQFYRVDRQGDWDAIDYGGRKAWFLNPDHDSVTVPSTGQLVTPRADHTSIPVYGRAYPEASDYPSYIPRKQVEHIVHLQYSIPAGQAYVMTGQMTADYYWSPTQTKRAIVRGQATYYQIFFNHRFAFVRASDVDIVPAA